MTDRLRSKIDEARRILDDAWDQYGPIRVFAGFSGGHESLVSSHLTLGHLPDTTVLHIDTGIGIERTRDFVHKVCDENEWPLWHRKGEESYDQFVLAHGFPGPGQHPRMYQRLKERVVQAVVKEAKREEMARQMSWAEWEDRAVAWCDRQVQKKRDPDSEAAQFWTIDPAVGYTEDHYDRAYTQFSKDWTVMISTGIRAAESMIRAGYKRTVSKVWAQVWVNPIYHFEDEDVRAYREHFGLPTNPIKVAYGHSGECTCGAFADWSERALIKRIDADLDARLTRLEEQVWASGLPWKWGDPGPPQWYIDAKNGQPMLFDPEPTCPWKERLAAQRGMNAKEWEAWCMEQQQGPPRGERLQEVADEVGYEIATALGTGDGYVGPMCWGCGKHEDS